MTQANVIFEGEDEVMALRVENAESAEFPSEEEQENDEKEETESEGSCEASSDGFSDGEVREDEDEDDKHSNYEDYDDNEVSFVASQNNNASIKEFSEDEEIEPDPAKLKSMMHFAKFLAKQGFI